MTDCNAEQHIQVDVLGDLSSSAFSAKDTPTTVSSPSLPPPDTQDIKEKSHRQRGQQRNKTREKEELNLEREKIEILKKVATNNSFSNEDSDDIFGKQVANEMCIIKDPAEKMQTRQSITRILYDAQDRSMSKTQQMSTYSYPASQVMYHTLSPLATSHQRTLLPYHQPPVTSTPHQPPGTFLGMLTSDQQGEETL